jgi:group II intron reverse transcriptase/maturase/CRISPR-associated endonuclease Cas1
MFKYRLEEIFSEENLKNASKNKDINFKKLSKDIITGKYIPKPLKRVEIPKNNNEKRPIAIAQEEDKAVQRCLYKYLNDFFNPLFSNHSYGYRPGKGTQKAINRCKDYIKRKYFHIYKSDINDFFETIDHQRLVNLLDLYIEDKRIINLISQFIENGLFEKRYIDHEIGIHQGDILSPLLSNIYLNQFDMFLERVGIEFVRFADDFVLFFKSFNEAKEKSQKAREFVQSLGLDFEVEKSYFSNIEKGFSFLGCFFRNSDVYIDKERFNKHIQSIKELKKLSLNNFLEKTVLKYKGFKNYYFKVITDKKQIEKIKSIIQNTIREKLIEEFKHKTKKEINEIIKKYEFDDIDLKLQVDIAYNEYKSKKNLIPKDKIKKQKKKVLKNLTKSSIIVVQEYGTFLGISKNKITIKKKGKIAKTFPKNRIKRVIINSKGVSFSSSFVHMCVKNGISIEFIDYSYNPYALLVSFNMAYPKTAVKQLKLLQSDKRMEFAKEFVLSKIVNQKNYLRYLNKYHKILDKEVENLRKLILKIKRANNIEMLMGYEGSAGAIYWQGIGKVLKEDNFKRMTFGAKDVINSAFNYGYALLYSKVKYSLIKAGLGVNISFLHSLDKKPVLVFDMVEEFRTYVVDRAVVFALNKSDDITLGNDGRLSKNARKRIIEEVNERFASLHEFKGEKRKVEDIIELQAFNLAKAINEDKKYIGFKAKF